MENSMTSNNLDMQLIVAAFETLANPTNSQSISSADKYILQCEKNPYFSMTLINILSQLPNSQTKFQILIHLKNVIKRNWTSKRRSNQSCILSNQMKEQIKTKLIDLYKQNWKIYYKQFNQIFKELSRFDFPKNYHLLNVFVYQVLTSLSTLSIDQILSSEQLLPYLSLVKVIYKQFGQRRILHTQQGYTKYIAKNVQISSSIMHKINDALLSIKTNLHQIDPELGIKLLECSRKIDKIILYCLHSIVASLQFDASIRQVIKFQLGKIQTLASIQSEALSEQVQLNILAILEGVSKLQQLFPLLFTQFLYQYLQLILQLLLQRQAKQQKLINCIIKSNIQPLKTFTYYMSVEQYKATLQYKMSNAHTHEQYQNICYSTFKTVYSQDNVGLFLEKIVGELMTRYSRANQEDQIIFQDAQHTHEGSNQEGVFQLLITLLKEIVSRFPQQSKLFISKLINHLMSQQCQMNTKQVLNMYQIILLLPKMQEQVQINMTSIYNLIQKCYTHRKFDLFCRLIRNYNAHFDNDTLVKSFDILIDIIGNNELQHFTLYQCAVCIRRIIVEHQSLPLNYDKIGSCLVKIFQLIEIYKQVPTHLWNLINLLISFLKSLSQNIIILNLVQLSYCINMILSTKLDNGSTIICAICDLLQNVLTLLDPNNNNNLQQKLTLYNSAINLLMCHYKKGTQQQEQSTEQGKNFLWLCIIKNIHVNQVPTQIKDKMLVLFQNMKESVIQEQPSLFFQILEEYYIGGFVQLSLNDLNSLYINLVQNSEPDNDIRINMGFFTLYLSYSLLTNNFDSRILLASMQKLKQIFQRISPSLNSLRTLLMLIINYSLIFIGAQKVIQLFNDQYKDYKQWFYPYIWSLQYTNNKYSAKVTSIAILRSMGLLKNAMCQQIQGNLPFDFIIKFITNYVQPIQIDQAINGYSICLRMFSHHEQLRSKNRNSGNKIQSRKAKLHVNANFCELNVAPIYKNAIGELFKEWNWGVDDLQERYTDGLIKKITELLN